MSAMPGKKAVVLISGGGTNLQAFIDAAKQGELDFDVSMVISNRPQAGGLARAQDAGIDTRCLPSKGFGDRAAYDRTLAAELDRLTPDLIILAGFMRILSAPFVGRYAGRILNIHPSLLPLYPGLHTHARALAAGDSEHGCTVHFVTEELDGGPPILQGRVAIEPGDSPETLAARVLQVEHQIYPRAANLFANGRITYRDGQCLLDNEVLRKPLLHPDSL